MQPSQTVMPRERGLSGPYSSMWRSFTPARLGGQQADHGIGFYGDVLGLGEDFGFAVAAFRVAVFLEPVKTEAAFGVYLALLSLVIVLDGLVDGGERVSDGNGVAAYSVDTTVTGVYLHARADGGLGEVGGRDVAFACEMIEGGGQFALESIQELAAGGGGSIFGAGTADEDD